MKADDIETAASENMFARFKKLERIHIGNNTPGWPKQPKKNQIQRTFVNVASAEHCPAYPAIDRIIEENRAKHINCASKVTLMRKMKR
ncbi:unnamed protein product [Alternaria alternata]